MNFIKRNIILVTVISILLIIFELTNRIEFISIFGLGFLIIVGSLFVPQRRLQQIIFIIGAFLVLWVIFLTKSVWLLVLAIVMTWFLFRTEDGHEFFFSGERRLHPFQSEVKYLDVVIRPQSEQRSLIHQQKIDEWVKETEKGIYPEEDINMVFFGGNTIIDLGNSFVTEGDKVVIIRKIFGRTRLILPRDMGLRLNVSAFSGAVVFERQTYHLQSENFQWVTPQYDLTSRKINLLVSVVFGEVEVVLL